MNASAVEKTARQTSAATERADGASVQGWSTRRLERNEHDRAAEHRARGRQHRIDPLEVAAEDRGAGIADGGGDDRELRDQLLLDPDSAPTPTMRQDADHPGHDAEELAAGSMLAGRG